MHRLRCPFKRSRTPTGAEMKSQSSLDVPKQVRSASFDEIQLTEAGGGGGGGRLEAHELRAIADIAMATSSLPSSSGSGSVSGQEQPAAPTSSLRIPQLQQTQRSKSFDVAAAQPRGSDRPGPDRSSSAAGYARFSRSASEREGPGSWALLQPQAAYACWHCACVDEWRASHQLSTTSDSADDEDDDDDDDDDGDNDEDEDDDEDDDEEHVDDEADEEAAAAAAAAGGDELQPAEESLRVEQHGDTAYYFVVLQRASEDADDDNSECSRREGSPEIRLTLVAEPAELLGPEDEVAHVALAEACRQRRRSLSRQEALPELPALLGVSAATSEEDELEQQPPPPSPSPPSPPTPPPPVAVALEPDEEQEPPENKAAGLVVRDIFLTVPDLRRDRAASVDSCFNNNNKAGKVDTCYSLEVPQQSVRSKSVDIVLPTEAQTHYTALLPAGDERRPFQGDEKDGTTSPSQREPRSTPDWSDAALNGEHLWVPTAASGEFCYVNDCSKHGPRLKCSGCRVVAHTACTASLNLACKPSYRDVGVRQYREQKVTNHHWVHRRSQKGKCANCMKSFQSKLSFSSKEIIAVSCSWCKAAYHNRESCFNAQRIGEQCELGANSTIIVPPSWIVKLPKRGNFKSSLRKSPKKRRGAGGQAKKSKDSGEPGAGDKEDPTKLWVIKPIPNANVTPVLVFINPRSGGNQGAKLLQKFQWLLNPRQVFDLTQGGPNMGLELFKRVPNLRILACGGDGTVGWVLSVLDMIGANPPPAVGTLPLGTGNDLARALGWGGGYTDEPIGKILSGMAESEISILDRWKLQVERNPDASGNDEDASKGKEKLPLNVVNNYFSLGVDAHIALEFHEAREAHPERFNSRLRNKMFYGQMGGKDLVVRRWKDLSEFVTLECDGQDMTAKLKEHRVHAILFLNIASYGGGTHPWGGGIGREPTTEDGLIEVVGLTTYQLPLLQAGGHGTSIAQCSTAKLVTSKTIPMQVDGEACRLLPSIIDLSLLNKATMLSKRRGGGRARQKIQPERFNVPLMRIKMSDYESFYADKERLTKTAKQWRQEPLDLDAAMDLDSLRRMLAKEYPMDSCCFLDSCTAERFFRIDRGQEQLHYVADVVSEAIYVLQEGPAGQGSHGQQPDNKSSSREESRRKANEKKARSETRGSDSRSAGRDGEQQQRSGASRSRDHSRHSANQEAPSRSRQQSRLSGSHADEEARSRQGSASRPHQHSASKSVRSAASAMDRPAQPSFISPRDRLFGLGSEVHTFSAELLEKTSDGILKAAKQGDLPTLKELHERGYSLLSIDATGQTALHIAAKLGYKDVVRYLIACAPPTILNMVDNDKGQTALHKAAQQKRRSICCMLVAGGAKLTVRDRSGSTPRELALAAEDRELAAYLHSQEQFQLVTEDMDNMP